MTPEELKKSILQLAIQGKLVEQRPEEGTADEIVQKISKYSSGYKKCKDELDYSSMEFEYPDNWRVLELNQLFDFVDYRGKTPNKISEGVFLITASNIRQGYMDYTRKEYISEAEYLTRTSRGITHKGDLLFTTEAPMGNAALCDLDKCSCGQRIITFQPYESQSVLPKLFMFFILSPQFQLQLLNNCTGTTAKGIKADKLKHFQMPLPPYKEQQRIVAKIEELLPLVDKYADAYNRLEELNKAFPGDLKKSILQYAIQGKLVEQRPEEGNADDLYAQIQADKQKLIKEGKIKKEKPLPEITDDESPFDIPESWKWVRFSNVISLLSGADLSPSKYNSEFKGIPYLTGASNIENKKVLINRWTEYPNNIAVKGNILLTCKGTVGKTAILCEDKVHIARQIMAITSIGIDSEYAEFFVQSQIDFLKSLAKSMIPGIERSNVLNLSFPLPPLQEQKRIVVQIKRIYQVLNL